MGAWIEIPNESVYHEVEQVAPLVGAWIEIVSTILISSGNRSLPSWERGLKYNLICIL